MLTAVRQARRRLLWNGLLSHGTNAFSLAICALILLLLFGTQVLDWRWLVPIPLAAAAAGIYVTRRRLPSLYRTAQLVDRRLALADTLSTAVHFSRQTSDVQRCQFEQAARLARVIDVRRAAPYTLPRGVYPLAALALVASSLFALRYGLTRRLDLKPPLARILPRELRLPQKTDLAQNAPRDPQSSNAPEDGQPSADAAGDPRGSPQAQPGEPRDPQAGGAEKTGKSGASSPQPGQGSQAGDEPANAQAESQADSQDSQNRGSGSPAKTGGRDASGNQDSSLLSKVKDAFQNLLSRMKPRPGNPGSKEESAMDRNARQSGANRDNAGKQQSANDGQREGQGESSDGQKGDTAQNPDNTSGKGAGKSDAREAGKQPGSGAGSQDGDKRIKQAGQLVAMGKISEIIGKRPAAITGQATVEVRSTAQQLQTPYASRDARHAQAGAEIDRDEIPVALQSYVEQYFAELRKQPAAKK